MKIYAYGVEVCQQDIQTDRHRLLANGRVIPLLIAAAGDLIQSRNRCLSNFRLVTQIIAAPVD